MIGLWKTETRVYETILRLQQTMSVPVTVRDVRANFSKRGYHVPYIIEGLCRRGFVQRNKFGDLTALVPTHERVIAEALGRSTVTREELFGWTKQARVVAVRRIVARRLRNEFGYHFSSIGKALNKHYETVADYFRPERCARRSIQRRQKYVAVKSAQSETRIAA